MNHIYKVIFNKATGTFVAVTEYARANGKGGARTVKSNIGTVGCALAMKASVIAMSLAGSGAAPQVYAATNMQQTNTGGLKYHQNGVGTVSLI